MLDWEQPGRQGRRFLFSGPRAENIAGFTDGVAMDPVRVYVGINSAETPEERADLYLQGHESGRTELGPLLRPARHYR